MKPMSIPYHLRFSKKAKYLQLRISSQGLFVVVPHKKPPSQKTIEDFIQLKKNWIEKNLNVIRITPKKTIELPENIHLPAFNQIWQVAYLKTISAKLKLITNPHNNQLTIIGDIAKQKQCLQLLLHWLKKIAQPFLANELQKLSDETTLFFNTVTIRNNTTRWGSCSSQKNINLCCKLLFLSPNLVRHVLLHELCHTRFMNHSKSFWQLLNRFDPDAFLHAKNLKNLRKTIPLWTETNFFYENASI